MIPYTTQKTPTTASLTISAPVLDVERLTVRYPGSEQNAIEDISFALARGEKVALIGPNGAGKSTLIRAIAGLVPAQTGQVSVQCCTVCGDHVGHCPVAYVPQRGEVRWRFPVTVAEVVMMGRYGQLGWFRRPRAADHAAVQDALEAMDLGALAEQRVGELSGGQQQRVMIARALAQEAPLLLLDEPLNNVDVRTQAQIFDTLDRLALDGRAILVSTHDLGSLQSEFQRALFLDRTLIADGPVGDVLRPDLLARAYNIDPHVCPPELLFAQAAPAEG